MAIRLFRQTDSDMTEGSIWRHLLEFAVPMAIGLLFQQLYNTVDAIVVGRYVSKEALAAVGSTGSIINTLVGFCAGLATGASVLVSQCYGAHENEKLHDAVHTTVAVSLIMCVLATLLGILFVDPMLAFMKTPSDVYKDAKDYLTVYFAGVTGLLMYNMGSGILRAVGDSRRPLYFLCISALLNIGFDLLFVLGFGMGVKGVAYATVLSQLISAVLVLLLLTLKKAPYSIQWKKLCIKTGTLRRILAVGLPSGLQQAVTSFSNVFVQSYINAFGSACMAGWTCCNKVEIYVALPVQALSLASTTFVGQNYGAGKLERARKGARNALTMSVCLTAVLVGVAMLLREPLITLFNDDPEVVYYGCLFVMYLTPFYILVCFNNIFAGALQGIGRARGSMIAMLSSFVVFRQIYLYINSLLGGSFAVTALGYPAGWAVCLIIMTVLYKRSSLCCGEKRNIE
ncbi:MAG TPA: MATE family efflux transporter [Bacillota bacterium]|nr:MATE family efflux transporter [Bacillota bacterium]